MAPMSIWGVCSQDNDSYEYLRDQLTMSILGVSSQDKGLYEHLGVSAHKIMAPMSIWGGGGS